MKCEYRQLGTLVERKIGYGIVQPGSSQKQGTPIIKVNNIISGLKNTADLECTTEQISSKYQRTKLRGGELIISVVGTIGKTAIVPKSFAGCNLVRATAMIDIPDLELAKWVKYYIDSPNGQAYIHQNLNTTVQPTLNIKSLSEMPIPFYSDNQMKQIIAVLESLDDKIILNNKINANLQQQAFCLFDQFLTKASGESVLISDIADLNPKRTLTKNQIAKCIDMAQLSTRGAFPDGWVDKPFKGGMRFTNGDTLLARITPCLENGKTAFIDFLNEGEVAFGSTEYIVLSPKDGIPPEFLYCLARYPAFVDYAVKNMNGSSGRQRVSVETIGQYSLPRLSEEQYQVFGEMVSPMFRKMKTNWMENMRLANVRDTLLPKLMAREIDISNFERSSSEKTSKEKRRFE